ncbi:precorrin-3B C(17)-methyltransferase [Methanococcus voltae]|uniref:Precorrin-3B C17-methyltransferase n=2 Tax=Methanococcus voltae TaxID=2188 RepID=A0A8J7USV2_METVO|nr:precorrin-3B C(17)-methyltransferase [Methanococcus voltae]MBP2172080.1 precorrin-3B C17-methyltransferase [Methanococcus voltae]MBP2200963.1 precorrin-3B C17-methyltransferase [Methanococcus voltae]MCS3921687.1 precorrin-3B C17-methyltransferase [Methanococcus voltae PS]
MLYVIGTGPGNNQYITKEADEVLKSVDSIVCYLGYKEFVESYGKPVHSTGMTKEIDRVKFALEKSKSENVALVSSGDATIYGMASLAYELNREYDYGVEIKTVAGLSSANMCSSILGAPLNHDFVTISLSDLLTPFEIIMKRILCALEGDFVISLYNPLSTKRKDPFLQTMDFIKSYSQDRDVNYIIGIVKNAGRDTEEFRITTINELLDNLEEYMEYIDMKTTLIIGNTNTKVIDGKMITPRGYFKKYIDNE